MTMQVLLTQGAEFGSVSVAAEQGWTNAWYFYNVAPFYHKTLSGLGGSWSIGADSALGSPSFSNSARFLHFWGVMWFEGGIDTHLGVVFYNGGVAQFSMTVNLSNTVTLYTGYFAGVASVGSVRINPLLSHWWGIYLKADNSGVCSVWCDGTLVATFTGDTQADVSPGWDRFVIQTLNGRCRHYIDDVIVTDDDGGGMTTPLPETFLTPQLPTSDDSGTLTPSTGGNRYSLLADVPSSQTSYAYASAADQGDYYGLSDPPSPASCAFVSVNAEATRSGSITHAKLQIDSGGTTSLSADISLPADPSWGIIQNFWNVNPNGGGAWDSASLNALKAGIKFTA